MVKAKQGKGRKITKVKVNKSKATEGKAMQVKAKPWRWGRAKAKLAGCFKKVKWGCPPSLATRELVTA